MLLYKFKSAQFLKTVLKNLRIFIHYVHGKYLTIVNSHRNWYVYNLE